MKIEAASVLWRALFVTYFGTFEVLTRNLKLKIEAGSVLFCAFLQFYYFSNFVIRIIDEEIRKRKLSRVRALWRICPIWLLLYFRHRILEEKIKVKMEVGSGTVVRISPI